MVQSLDQGVAAVLEALRRSGAGDDTIVIFTSDNGGERYSRMWPLVGEKGDLLEGGIRVPAFVRYPGLIPAATTSDQVAITMDWTASLLRLGGASPRMPLDGIDLLPMLSGASPRLNRRLYWRFVGQRQSAVRDGAFKYLRVGKHEYLFNIDNDPRERANLAPEQPKVVARMRQTFETWNRSMLPDTGIEGYVFGPDRLAGRPD